MGESLRGLAEFLTSQGMACECGGDAGLEIHGVATLEEAGPDDVSFLANRKYERLLATTRAGAVVVAREQAAPERLAVLRVGDPYAAITMLIVRLYGHRRHPGEGIDPRAVIAPTARIGENATIRHGVTVEQDAVIGRNVVLYPGVYIGPGARLGDDCVLFPNVVIYDGCELGHRVTIHAGSVIGEDGLGYAPVGGKWVKIPQVGTVEVADDVEIGANCTIDRATLGRTVIGPGTKFSNLIAIGHGTRVGADCLFVAQVGLAGSVNVGRHVTMAGKVGVAGHLTIGDNVRIGAMAGVMRDIDPNTEVLGQPAMLIADARRVYAALQRLPEMRERLRHLEAELERLRKDLPAQSQA
jgi:UDP-3-O-[3-hydroxymyristoyl] glucosamine N-acyltransferase